MMEAIPDGERHKLDSPVVSKDKDHSISDRLADDYQKLGKDLSLILVSNISPQHTSKSFEEQDIEMIAFTLRKFGLESIISLSKIMKRQPKEILDIWLTIDGLSKCNKISNCLKKLEERDSIISMPQNSSSSLK